MAGEAFQGHGSTSSEYELQQKRANAIVHGLAAEFGGSVSAEHGLGVLRAEEAARLKSAVELRMLGAVRAALDPAGIMNPGKGIAAAGVREEDRAELVEMRR